MKGEELRKIEKGKLNQRRQKKLMKFKKAQNEELKLDDQALMASVMRPTELDHLRVSFGASVSTSPFSIFLNSSPFTLIFLVPPQPVVGK